ncbi:MAG: family 16 glycoside hydrolase, partial [Planctomycetaceae bacterium]
SDFVLRIEWKIPKGGNSGVGLRFPPTGDPAHVGMEIQILDDGADEYKNLVDAQYTGGIYYQAAAKHGVAKPVGEWNQYEITCLGPHVTVVLNGQVVNDAMVDTYKEGKGGHAALADRPEIGHVGMQSHGSRVDFRNIEIKNLTKTTASGLQYVDIKPGDGAVVPAGGKVLIHYTGRLVDGKRFENSRDREAPVEMPLNGVIPGLQEGIAGMKVGGRRKLIVPPSLGYLKRGDGKLIPPDATLIFDVEVKGLP